MATQKNKREHPLNKGMDTNEQSLPEKIASIPYRAERSHFI